jgi:hypothetical protein
VFFGAPERVNLTGRQGAGVVMNRLSRSAVVRGAALVWGLLAACTAAWAGELSGTAQKEITQLLDRIETSNCSFNRNGSWYAASEARKHLQMKLDYMVKRNMLGSAEEFISKAATASSVSGEPYQIRCGTQAPVASAVWLTAELKRLRTST